MELKPYQQQVINDIALFLEQVQLKKNPGDAFHDFWTKHPRTSIQPFPKTAVEPYKNNIPRVPHVCIKVPTAGGKTFIACNALKPILGHFTDKPKAVVWLVPSITILDQTIKNLKDPSHPYRQKINSHFGNRVEIFDKAALLQGTGFNASTINEQLSIMVFSFDSLRAKNKEDRKIFQENGNLQSFESIIGKEKDLTLGAVINYLNPLVIVDESHNAESDLSVEMLKELNPCFILDLTATPRKNSNIISFIDAMELKQENMVKLPVIVYNHHDKTEVINSALQLQKQLEKNALEEEKKGGKYIRPIVLFQAQPKNMADNTTFEKLKEKLIELKIPAEQIRIKTANNNEIKNEDLMSRNCPVRYIITVNALKEGWDCPFAYILASLADKSSSVDVEQILGRVLRQPYVTKHEFSLLNMSYVLTASSRFLDTLDNIVKGLNKAGFSDKDYKLANPGEIITEPDKPEIFDTEEDTTDIASGIDVSRIITGDQQAQSTVIENIQNAAIEQNRVFEQIVTRAGTDLIFTLPNELQPMVKTFKMKDLFRERAQGILLPQFFLKIPEIDLFGQHERESLLEKENLLEEFQLGNADTNIEFNHVSSELYKIDLDADRSEHTPTFVKLDGNNSKSIMKYILDPSLKHHRVKNMTRRIMDIIGNYYSIPDKELEKYLNRILENFTDEQFNDFGDHQYTYIDKIKAAIKLHSEKFAAKKFKLLLDTDGIYIKPFYRLPDSIFPGDTSKDIPKTLYEKEGRINGFEESMINEIANFENIAFWTRNIEKKGFKINGFINHYPDFIIHSKSGKTIILETKGDHLEAEQKISLGNLWASKAGNYYRYCLVYENRAVEGAYKKDDFLATIRKM